MLNQMFSWLKVLQAKIRLKSNMMILAHFVLKEEGILKNGKSEAGGREYVGTYSTGDKNASEFAYV